MSLEGAAVHLASPGAQVEHDFRSGAGIGHISAFGASLLLTYLLKRQGRGRY